MPVFVAHAQKISNRNKNKKKKNVKCAIKNHIFKFPSDCSPWTADCFLYRGEICGDFEGKLVPDF